MDELISCWKRAASFAKPGPVDSAHPMMPVYSNMLFFIDGADDGDFLGDLYFLDLFAKRLDKHAKDHMLKDDETVASMLHEWKRRMFFNPVIAYG